MIYDAAESCSPPLFKDQPQEKININSKLGFGLHSELKLDNEGETHWYTPMSCEKIKLHMPHLCTPNIDCTKIGNPLTFQDINISFKLLEGWFYETGGDDSETISEKNEIILKSFKLNIREIFLRISFL